MKKMLMIVAGLLVGALVAAEAPKMTLADAREKISAVIAAPEKMGEVMQQLSAEDQKAFLAEVNKAIANMPGSNESKTAKFLNVNREALLNAKKGNLQSLVATMFSSMKLEGLTVVADRFGEDLFNRSADSEKSFTDEQFTEIASSTVKEVAKECKPLADAAQRDTIAIYLFEKASNGTVPDLEDRLLEVAFSDTATRETAKNEWLAAAKSEGVGGFSALLASAEAGRVPNSDSTLKIAGPQAVADALSELESEQAEEKPNVDVVLPRSAAQAGTSLQADQAQKVVNAQGEQIMPQTKGESATGRDTATANQTAQSVAQAGEAQPKTNADVPYNPTYNRDEATQGKKDVEPEPEPEPEPKPYPYQD